MDAIFDQWQRDSCSQHVPINDDGTELIWLPDKGMGFFPVPEEDWPYDQDYFDKYKGYSQTKRGELITKARVDFVHRFYHGPILDVGIGSGDFVLAYGTARGFDVNPAAVRWLKNHGKLQNPLWNPLQQGISFWDSLEHLPCPGLYVLRSLEWVFICTPIFRDLAHLMTSKHLRPNEHYWYWTADGLIRWMGAHGFDWQGSSMIETMLGREDIETFAFKRR